MEQGGELLYADITFVLRGVFFTVHNRLGRFRNEQQYCDEIEKELKDSGIFFEREKVLEPSSPGEHRGRCRVDFLIDNTILIEVKTVSSFSPDIYSQCKRYLVCSNKKLLLLVNFFHKRTVIERVLNPEIKV